MWKKLAVSFVAGTAILAGCDSTTEPPERIVTALECDADAPREGLNCVMELQEPGGLVLQLETITCLASGNVVRITEPVDEILTTDACYLDSPGTWEYPGPFDAGTVVVVEFTSAQLKFEPGVFVTGEYPTWLAHFEDGGDEDFDDLLLTVTVVPTETE
jgi:hypothetical protein